MCFEYLSGQQPRNSVLLGECWEDIGVFDTRGWGGGPGKIQF